MPLLHRVNFQSTSYFMQSWSLFLLWNTFFSWIPRHCTLVFHSASLVAPPQQPLLVCFLFLVLLTLGFPGLSIWISFLLYSLSNPTSLMTLHFTCLLITFKFLLLDQMSSSNSRFVYPISFSTYPFVYPNDISNLICSKQAPNLLPYSYHGFPISVHYTLRVAQNTNLRVILDSFLSLTRIQISQECRQIYFQIIPENYFSPIPWLLS